MRASWRQLISIGSSSDNLLEEPKLKKSQPVQSLAKLLIQSEGENVYEQLVEGATWRKLQKKHRLSELKLSIDPSCFFLNLGSTTVPLSKLEDVRFGYLSQRLLKHDTMFAEELCLVIVYLVGDERKVKSLVAPSKQVASLVGGALSFLLRELRSLQGERIHLEEPWNAHNNGKATMTWKQVWKMLASLNMELTGSATKKIIARVDLDGDNELNFGEFVKVMRLLRSRSKISELFAHYSDSDGLISAPELATFLDVEQNERVSVEAAQALIDTVSPKDATLDALEFELFLTSRVNEAFDPERAGLSCDMTRPLSHYWIDSSHNTFLTGDQLQSDSSIEMYIRAFQMGCRCVELDTWDGDDGEPRVFHGYTLTKPILFRDIIRVVKSHGFVTSEYPIILSLQNQCSEAQQQRMAQHMTGILGDMLAPQGNWEHELPSPESLKRRVLIKGKMTARPQPEKIARDGEPPKKGKKVPICDALRKLVFLKAAHFESFEEACEWNADAMSSFSEPKTWKLLDKGEGAGLLHFRRYNERHLSRIYPKGTRVDSSNYEPIVPWGAGCQIVALNYQTDSAPMWINFGRFRENNRTGYVLRPAVTFPGGEQSSPLPIKRLRLRVFSARLLPKTARETIDPYVSVTLHDGSEDPVKHKSSTVKNNGFNPNWDFEATFEVRDADSAHLVFKVVDEESFALNTKVGQACIPLTCLRSGYRSIHLYDDHFKVIGKGLTNVFVHIAFEFD